LGKSAELLKLAEDLAEGRSKVVTMQCLSCHSLITDDKFTESKKWETKHRTK